MSSFHRTMGLLMVSSALVACSGGGGGGGSSEAPAQKPTQLTAQALAGGVRLDWAQVANAVEYAVFVGTQSGFAVNAASELGTIAAPPADIDGTGVTGRFFFRVTARFADGRESAPSNETSFDFGGGGGGGADPLLAEQWHIENLGQGGGTPGEDARVKPVWAAGINGSGVRIAVVDDGLEIGHEDIAANVLAGASFNYTNGSSDPTGGAHGTSCAGVAASVGENPFGGRGAAFGAKMFGYNLLQAFTDANQGDAMVRGLAQIDVSSNSWGAEDGLGVAQLPPNAWFQGVVQGVSQGRGGKGVVYLWAAGNGATPVQGSTLPVDDSNLDGQANFPFVIAVGAVGDDGIKAVYSENGANLLVCAPSMGRANHGITTVDRTGAQGFNSNGANGDFGDTNYTNTFNGTSAATPLVAGVVALMLDANPNLTWRDVRLLLARTARQNDASDADWALNGAGLHVNHKYGFGVIDAQAAVAAAQSFASVGGLDTLVQSATPPLAVNLAIPDANSTGVTQSFAISGSGIQSLEFVEVLFDTDHTFPGDLLIFLRSPRGTVSVLHEPHSMDPSGRLQNWVFSTMRCMDEPADGTWSITVLDLQSQDTGTFKNWQIGFSGR